MPTPGPVAYHVHSGFFTLAVISIGFDHVTPSSSLFKTHTVIPARLEPAVISFSLSAARFCVVKSQSVPVLRSTTAHGLTHASGPLSPTTRTGDQVAPASVLRR